MPELTINTRGEIDPNRMYSLTRIIEILGIGKAGLRSMRRAGLPVRYVGRNAFYFGGDVIDWVRSHGKESR